MSTKYNVNFKQQLSGMDEPGKFVFRKDVSGGQNTRIDPQNLPENQVQELTNANIGVVGQSKAIPGSFEIDEIVGAGGCFNILGFEPDGGVNSLRGVFLSGASTAIYQWASSGDFTKILGSDDLVTVSGSTALTAFKTGGDGHVSLFGSDTKNWVEVKQDGTVVDLGNTSGTGSDSPPRSSVGTSYNDRVWILKDNKLYYADALPSDFSNTFSTTTQVYNMNVGEERFLLGVRGKGLICGGKDLIRYITPSTTPAATDEYGILVDIGCEAGKTAKIVGDDILYLAKDGVRGIFKTQYDTLQYGSSLPISYQLKDSFEIINWAHIDKACAIYFDNKYFLALPTNSSTVCNTLWIYFPASQGWVTVDGLEIGGFATLKVAGADKLYATQPDGGKVFQLWRGSQLNGTDITYTEIGRYEDFGSQVNKKTGGELHFKAKATGSYTINFYLSLDESEFSKIGELTTEDRSITFPVTFPVLFQSAGTYVKRINFNSYGRWFNAQYKIECTGAIGDDLTILERGIRAIKEEYLPNEEN